MSEAAFGRRSEAVHDPFGLDHGIRPVRDAAFPPSGDVSARERAHDASLLTPHRHKVMLVTARKQSVALAAALLALTACSSGQTNSPPESPAGSLPSSVSPEPSPSETVQTLPAKVAFPYSPPPEMEQKKAPEWQVTLTATKCGLKSIPEAQLNPEYDGSDDIPEEIAAKPDAGNDFCVLYWSWENVGDVPATTDFSGDLMIGEKQHAASPDDQMMAWTVMDTELGVAYAGEVNPGKSTKSVDIYQVPEGAMPDAVWFPEVTVGAEQVLVSTS